MANTTSGTATFDKTFAIDEIVEEAYQRIGVTQLDGYPLAKKGFGGHALIYALIFSTLGGIFGLIMLMDLSDYGINLRELCLPSFGNETFSKKAQITDWEKVNTLDC